MNSTNQTQRDAGDARKALGQRIAAIRHERGWNQDFVAEKLGMTKAGVSAWETGRNLPDALALVSLSNLFGIGVDALLTTSSSRKRGGRAAASG